MDRLIKSLIAFTLAGFLGLACAGAHTRTREENELIEETTKE